MMIVYHHFSKDDMTAELMILISDVSLPTTSHHQGRKSARKVPDFGDPGVRCSEGKLHRLPTWCRFMTICLEDILWENVYNYNHGKPPVVSIAIPNLQEDMLHSLLPVEPHVLLHAGPCLEDIGSPAGYLLHRWKNKSILEIPANQTTSLRGWSNMGNKKSTTFFLCVQITSKSSLKRHQDSFISLGVHSMVCRWNCWPLRN